MRADGVNIGMLYTDEAVWFFRYDLEADRLEVSPCVLASQLSPITAAGALLYAGKLAICSSSMAPTRPKPADGPPGHQVRMQQTSDNEHSNGQDGIWIVATLGFILGDGSTGTVWECKLDDREGRFAIKVYKDSEDNIDKARHEASMYKILSKLQGQAIPSLLSWGVLTNQPGDSFTYLLTSLHGIPLSELTEPLSQEQETAVLDSLAAIHSLGIIHG